MLVGTKVFLRLVEPQDATRILLWENNPAHWKVSDTEVPFSMQDILYLIEQAHNIRSTGQIRFMISKINTQDTVGIVDLFDANFKHGRAGVGVLIGEVDDRAKGYASEAIDLLAEYASSILGFHNLHCSIHSDNEASVKLFKKGGFEQVGIRKEWYLDKGKRIDELIFQKCLRK
jgi:diamine N-acetyltransferase